MPSFTFTLADGRKGTVNAPEGTTQEQAYGYLQQQMQSQQQQAQPQEPTPTPAKPAPIKSTDVIEHMRQQDPLNRPPGALSERAPRTSFGEAVGAVGTSSALGASIAALSPEIVTGLGVVSLAIPVAGEVIGPALMEAGTAMRAGRLAATSYGALSGAMSETAGQIVQAKGGTVGQAEAARLVAGGFSPSAAAVKGFVSKPLGLAWKMAQKLAGMEASTPKAVQAAREGIAAMAEAGQPQLAHQAMLQKGVQENERAANAAADAHMANVYAEAAKLARTDPEASARLVEQGKARADKMRADATKLSNVLEKASDGKIATANRVLAQAQPELAKVGQSRELSDIGTSLRGAATSQEQAQVAARQEAYQATVAERDATVSAREASGESVDSTAGMQALKKDLETKLGTDSKGFVRTTDQGVRRGYQQVYDAINRREVITGVNPDGTPIKQIFKTSFEALDHVRRRLGDVVAGQDVEGYAAIGKQAARKMYGQISKIQEEFAGPAQKTLQTEYADATRGLEEFGSKTGKKLTAMDRLGLEHVTDPKELPKRIFSSRQSVRDARGLIKNDELLNKQASDYATRNLQGHDAKGVAKWARENEDWMREIPGLSKKVKDYGNKLEQIERVNAKLQSRAKSLRGASEKVRQEGIAGAEAERQATIEEATRAAKGSEETQQRVLKQGRERAEEIRAERYGPAKGLKSILEGGEAPENIRKLLLEGKPEQTRLAAQIMAGEKGGTQVLEQSVRQVMRNMSEGTLRQQWTERILPMLRDGKMIPPERLAALEVDVNRLLKAYKGPDKLSLVQRHIAAALGAAPSVAMGRK